NLESSSACRNLRRGLVLDTAKSRVGIRKTRSKPIPVGPPHQPRRRARGGAFQHIVVTVTEGLRVAGIEREWLKAREGIERRRGPLPAVPNQLRDPECAIAKRRGRDRDGVPSLKVEIAARVVGKIVAPGIRALLARRAAVRLAGAFR